MHGNTLATWTDQVPTTLRIAQADPCDGMKLSGSYRLDAAASTYAPKAIPSIKFTADGQFSEDGLVRIIDPGTIKSGGGNIDSQMPADGGRGHYTIGKNTVTLTYADGSKLSLGFFGTAEDLSQTPPAAIFMHRSRLILLP